MDKIDIPKTINSVSKYIEAIFNLRKSKEDESSCANFWFFRGQKCSLWSMRPSVFRGNALGAEFDMIQRALRQRPFDFRDCTTDFEILTKLQHYGLGTRLLDVTLNPLVALYFASEPFEDIEYGKDNRGKKVFRDGKIVFHYGYGHKLSELNIRIACAIPFLDFDNTTTLSKLCALLRGHSVISADEEGYLRDNDFKKMIEAVQASHYVISSYSNERLIRQSGSFIVPTAIKIVENQTNIGDSLIRKSYCDLDNEFDSHAFIIPYNKKEAIREELDFLNINEATLFPELEHQLTYLQSKKAYTSFSAEPYEQYIRSTAVIKREQKGLMETPESCGNNEPHPDICKIVSLYIDNNSNSYKDIISIIEKATSAIDWWCKESTISQIRRDITRFLQTTMSASESKLIASNIVALLSNPGKEYSAEISFN